MSGEMKDQKWSGLCRKCGKPLDEHYLVGVPAPICKQVTA